MLTPATSQPLFKLEHLHEASTLAVAIVSFTLQRFAASQYFYSTLIIPQQQGSGLQSVQPILPSLVNISVTQAV